MKQTTKVLYCSGNSCGNQYATGNCKPYGTKWRITLRKNYYGEMKQIGLPVLLDANWDIDDKKIQESDRFYSNLYL